MSASSAPLIQPWILSNFPYILRKEKTKNYPISLTLKYPFYGSYTIYLPLMLFICFWKCFFQICAGPVWYIVQDLSLIWIGLCLFSVCLWLYDYWSNTKNAVLWLVTMFRRWSMSGELMLEFCPKQLKKKKIFVEL